MQRWCTWPAGSPSTACAIWTDSVWLTWSTFATLAGDPAGVESRHMNPVLVGVLLAGGLFFGMLLLIELGRRVGNRHLAKDPEGARAGVGAIEGAVFALLGLLIAFTFSGAASRFDTR